MAKTKHFTFLCDEKERRAITCLAQRLARSQSDAIRFIIVEAERQLSQVEAAPNVEISKPREPA